MTCFRLFKTDEKNIHTVFRTYDTFGDNICSVIKPFLRLFSNTNPGCYGIEKGHRRKAANKTSCLLRGSLENICRFIFYK
jgi:hypothetical protein